MLGRRYVLNSTRISDKLKRRNQSKIRNCYMK